MGAQFSRRRCAGHLDVAAAGGAQPRPARAPATRRRRLHVGFTTHDGTVTAARDWDAPAQRRIVRPSLAGSLERELHDHGISTAVPDLRGGLLGEERLQRMIGVIYRPETERQSHYVTARAADQYELLVHVDITHALDPIERWSAVEEPADTYPSGL